MDKRIEDRQKYNEKVQKMQKAQEERERLEKERQEKEQEEELKFQRRKTIPKVCCVRVSIIQINTVLSRWELDVCNLI